MLRKGHGGLYKAPTKEERRKRKAKRGERDQIKFIDLRFERWQVVRFRKGKRGQDLPCLFTVNMKCPILFVKFLQKMQIVIVPLHMHCGPERFADFHCPSRRTH